MKLANSLSIEFVIWYESLLLESLDSFRNERKGRYEMNEIGEEAKEAFLRSYEIVHHLENEEKNEYSRLNTIEGVSLYLLFKSNQSLETLFLENAPLYAYMPNLSCYAKEVERKLLYFCNK